MMYAIIVMIAQVCDPALTALFTPPHPEVGRYEVCTTANSLDAIIEEDQPSAGRQGLRHSYGAIEALEALDAFGAAGPYNRSALARLYGGRRVRVAHGWKQTGGQFESITLLSPYPDASLTHLLPGTLVIRWHCSMQNAECR